MKTLHWLKGVFGPEDAIYTPPEALAIPRRMDLRKWCSPIEDQGQIGSCTANAIVGMLEWLENKNHEDHFVRLSRLFVYYNERNIEGTTTSDSGAFLKDGLHSIGQFGICEEAVWPYNEGGFTVKPDDKAYTEALARRYHKYYRVPVNKDLMIKSLAEGYPFVFGTQVDENTFCVEVPGGKVQMITGNEQGLGGHAMCCVGYDLDQEVFIVRNSWGTSWGDNGYCYFPMAYLSNPEFTDDMWTVRGTFSNN